MAEGKNKPDGTAYTVRDFEISSASTGEVKKRSNWLKIGVVWKHNDEEGFNIDLEAVPVNGRIVVRTNKPDGSEPD